LEFFIAIDGESKLLASEHGEAIYDHLGKSAMVQVSEPCRVKSSKSLALSEIAKSCGAAMIGVEKQADGHDKDGREGIDKPYVHIS